MNKNVTIGIAVIVAAALGYFIAKGAGGPRGNAVAITYASCIQKCEQEHTTNLASINQKYERCLDGAQEELIEDFLACAEVGNPCHGNSTKPPCRACWDRAIEKAKLKRAECLKDRNMALEEENETHRKCKSKCNYMISFKEN